MCALPALSEGRRGKASRAREAHAAKGDARLPRTLGEWIAELRLERRKVIGSRGRLRAGAARETVRPWARADLAELASISEPTLYRIETDSELPSFHVLESLLKALDVWPWQFQMLRDMWTARAARVTNPPRVTAAMRREAVELLSELPFPAMILDEFYNLKACNRYFDAVVGTNRPRGAILSFFDPTVTFYAMGSRQMFQGQAVRRFLLHIAPWSMLPGFAPAVERLERAIHGDPSWRAAIHSDQVAVDKVRRVIPDVGEIDFFGVDKYRNEARSVLLRIWMPLHSSLERYDHLRTAMDRSPEPPYVAPDWKA